MTYIIDKITKKNNGFEIVIQNQSFLVDSFLYSVLLPYVHKKIEEEQLEIIQVFSKYAFIIQPLYLKMNKKELSIYDVKKYLQKKDLNNQEIDQIIKLWIDEECLNDQQFIQYHCKEYEKNKGKDAFKAFLNRHGIHPLLIEQALEQFQENETWIQNYIQKQISKNQHSAKYLKYKIEQNLLQKGFSYALIEKYLNTMDADDSEQLKKDYLKLKLKNEKNPYKIISKLIQKGYNVDDIKKIMKDGEDAYE